MNILTARRASSQASTNPSQSGFSFPSLKLNRCNMLRKSILAGLAGIAVAIAALPAQAAQWVQLGEQKVNHSADRDTLYVGAYEGRYEALRFRVTGNEVAFAEVRVVYGNGTSEVLDVKEHVQPGETTRPYDLRGQHRIIERVEFLYQSESQWARRATVQVLGLMDTAEAPAPSPAPSFGGWTSLGTREVSLEVDHDAINVGYGAGRFRTLRFHVSGEPIHLYDIRVTFGNGEVQTFNFDEHIPAGSYSRSFDLSGRERVISRIDLVYKKSHRGGLALMTVYGQT